MDLIAKKAFSYRTRRLQPGDPFEAPEREARLLIGIKRAEAATVTAQDGRARHDPLDHDKNGRRGGSPKPAGGLSAIRQEYFEKIGKRAFNGWDEAELRRRIDAA